MFSSVQIWNKRLLFSLFRSSLFGVYLRANSCQFSKKNNHQKVIMPACIFRTSLLHCTDVIIFRLASTNILSQETVKFYCQDLAGCSNFTGVKKISRNCSGTIQASWKPVQRLTAHRSHEARSDKLFSMMCHCVSLWKLTLWNYDLFFPSVKRYFSHLCSKAAYTARRFRSFKDWQDC